MKAIVVTDQAAGTAGMTLVERPEPDAARLASDNPATHSSSDRPAWAAASAHRASERCVSRKVTLVLAVLAGPSLTPTRSAVA